MSAPVEADIHHTIDEQPPRHTSVALCEQFHYLCLAKR